jgi:hypothetical protein
MQHKQLRPGLILSLHGPEKRAGFFVKRRIASLKVIFRRNESGESLFSYAALVVRLPSRTPPSALVASAAALATLPPRSEEPGATGGTSEAVSFLTGLSEGPGTAEGRVLRLGTIYGNFD